jgi:hypothetical protein
VCVIVVEVLMDLVVKGLGVAQCVLVLMVVVVVVVVVVLVVLVVLVMKHGIVQNWSRCPEEVDRVVVGFVVVVVVVVVGQRFVLPYVGQAGGVANNSLRIMPCE